MALRGTLKDFGIAEIFQLIGGQGKSGTLYLESKKEKLKLLFERGAIVGVETGGKERFGSLLDSLMQAELLTPTQAREALNLQKKTLRRLPDILREQGWVRPDILQEMMALETNEALYELFTWQQGTYRFEAGEVDYDEQEVKPRSLEHFLMEGFRRVDEWPLIRRRIGSYDAAFEVVAQLPPEGAEDIGPQERRIFDLVTPERELRKIIDLSRMGEFEACRAVQHLVDTGYIRPVQKAKPRRRDRIPGRPTSATMGLEFVAKGLIALAVIGLLFVLLLYANPDLSGLLRPPPEGTLGPTDTRTVIGSGQLERLRQALEVYRLEKGRYPEKLDDLVAVNLVSSGELHYPWDQPYYYRHEKGYVLYRPAR